MRAATSRPALSLIAICMICAAALSASAQSPVCVEITIAADGQEPPADGFFPALEVLDLQLFVSLSGITGEHLLELELYTPRGHLYQVLTAAVSASPTKSAHSSGRKVPGFPYPLPVQYLRPAGSDQKVLEGASVRLPVAGTSIITASLYGTWQVTARVDGQPADCGTKTFFTLSTSRSNIFSDGFESGNCSGWSSRKD